MDTLGKKVRAQSGDVVYEGIAESAGKDGSLRLLLPGGESVSFTTGDVTLVK
jgi:biotin-(acetyl-CoA carboxylase) ligase